MEGVALTTRFMLRASRWLDEADALPLTYSFELAGAEAELPEPVAPTYPAAYPATPSANATSAAGATPAAAAAGATPAGGDPPSSWVPLADTGLGPTLSTHLPEGAAARGHALRLRLHVCNSYGAVAAPPQAVLRVTPATASGWIDGLLSARAALPGVRLELRLGDPDAALTRLDAIWRSLASHHQAEPKRANPNPNPNPDPYPNPNPNPNANANPNPNPNPDQAEPMLARQSPAEYLAAALTTAAIRGAASPLAALAAPAWARRRMRSYAYAAVPRVDIPGPPELEVPSGSKPYP